MGIAGRQTKKEKQQAGMRRDRQARRQVFRQVNRQAVRQGDLEKANLEPKKQTDRQPLTGLKADVLWSKIVF